MQEMQEHSPQRLRREFVAVLALSSALEYVYSLSQYTARVQFPDLLQRPRALATTSLFFVSKYAKDFYWVCRAGCSAFGCCAADREFSS